MTALGSAGYSFIELMFVIGLICTMSIATVPPTLAAIDELRTLGAARYVAARLQQARMEAVIRGADTTIRFVRAGASYRYGVYVDGNRDGVRSRDIDRGIDREVVRPERLVDQFAGVDFGALAGLPPVDASSPPPGNDPVRLGAGNMATFTAAGTATPGSLYIRSRKDTQYVIRIFGDTGKTRMLKFDRRSRQWKAL
jgi:type II secretory pathway pseudopilin PulG